MTILPSNASLAPVSFPVRVVRGGRKLNVRSLRDRLGALRTRIERMDDAALERLLIHKPLGYRVSSPLGELTREEQAYVDLAEAYGHERAAAVLYRMASREWDRRQQEPGATCDACGKPCRRSQGYSIGAIGTITCNRCVAGWLAEAPSNDVHGGVLVLPVVRYAVGGRGR